MVEKPASSSSECGHEPGVECHTYSSSAYDATEPADLSPGEWESAVQIEEAGLNCEALDPPVKKLPGLVPRPLTLPQVVAEAITEAAYKQGSNDNLATVAVDLIGPKRLTKVKSHEDIIHDANASGRSPQPQGRQSSFPVPRRSTATSPSAIIQAGEVYIRQLGWGRDACSICISQAFVLCQQAQDRLDCCSF